MANIYEENCAFGSHTVERYTIALVYVKMTWPKRVENVLVFVMFLI